MGINTTPTVLIITGITSNNQFQVYRKYLSDIAKDKLQIDIDKALQLVKRLFREFIWTKVPYKLVRLQDMHAPGLLITFSL